MNYVKPLLRKLLERAGKSADQSEYAILNSDEELINYLIKEKKIAKEVIDAALFEHYHVQHYQVGEAQKLITTPKNLLELYKKYNFIAYEDREGKLTAAYLDVFSEEAKRITRQVLPNIKQTRFILKHEMETEMKRIDKLIRIEGEGDGIPDLRDNSKINVWVNEVIRLGIRRRCSDIHFEIGENYYQVRYRIDGVLSKRYKMNFSEEQIQQIVSYIKITSEMDIGEKRKPQDGRMSDFVCDDSTYDIRVSTVLTNFGEKIVMRLFKKDTGTYDFKSLGFYEEDINKLEGMVRKPYGIIYLSGATGSGKTTTLYAMIESINSSDVNIYTIEDPIEKSIDGVNQIEINPDAGVNYDNTLKALLRQDPDIIVIGEVRDKDTVETSVRTALTGHLVFATVHANNSVETISRLYNMGVEPYLLAAASIGFLSQRLLRLLCPHCKIKRELTAAEKIWMEEMCKRYGVCEGIDPTEFYSANPDGCDHCDGIGYKGRSLLPEIMMMDDELRGMVSKGADSTEITRYLLENGFRPFEVNGLMKVRDGVTSLEEVMRVLQ